MNKIIRCSICALLVLVVSCGKQTNQGVSQNSIETAQNNNGNQTSNNQITNNLKKEDIYEIPVEDLWYEYFDSEAFFSSKNSEEYIKWWHLLSDASPYDYQYAIDFLTNSKNIDMSGIIIYGSYLDDNFNYKGIKYPEEINGEKVTVIIDPAEISISANKLQWENTILSEKVTTIILPETIIGIMDNDGHLRNYVNIDKAQYVYCSGLINEPTNAKEIYADVLYDYNSFPDRWESGVVRFIGNYIGKGNLVINEFNGAVTFGSKHGSVSVYELEKNINYPSDIEINGSKILTLGINDEMFHKCNVVINDSKFYSSYYNGIPFSSVIANNSIVCDLETEKLVLNGDSDMEKLITKEEMEIINNSGKTFDWSQIVSENLIGNDYVFETGRLKFQDYYIDVKKGD